MKERLGNEIDYVGIGKRVRVKRLEKGFTQEQLSEQVKITPNYLSNIETASVPSVGLQTLINLANALDTSVDYLLYDSLHANQETAYENVAGLLNQASSEDRTFLTDLLTYISQNKQG